MDMAERMQKTQSWVSLVEGGRIALTADLVAQWCDILNVPDAERQDLMAMFAREHELFVTWIEQAQSTHDLRETFADHERSASLIRDFQVTGISGLYQSPQYIDAVFHVVKNSETDLELSDYMQVRLARQAILYDREKQIESVIFEQALAFKFGDNKVMAHQLEHLAYIIEKELADIVIVPSAISLPMFPYSNWTMFDDRIAVVELSPGQVSFTKPTELAPLNYAFASVWDIGLREQEAQNFILELARRYERYEYSEPRES